MTDLRELLVRYKGDTKGLVAANKRAEKAVTGFGRKTSTASAKVATSFKSMTAAFAPLLGALTALQAIRVADDFVLLRSRIQAATRSTDEFNATFNGLQRIAAETGVQLGTSVEVFQRLSFARDEIGATAEEMLQFTENVQKLGVVAGAETANLNAGLRQLGQGLSAGTLRAEEFNSVLENIPAVGQAIANSMGVSVGELRKLVLEGEVASKEVFQAILAQTEQINTQFENFPKTAGRAFNELKLEAFNFVGALDESTKAGGLLINIIEFATRRLREMRLTAQIIGQTFSLVFLIARDKLNDLAVSFQDFVIRSRIAIEDLSGGLIKFDRLDISFENDIKEVQERINDISIEIFKLGQETEVASQAATTFSASQDEVSGKLEILKRKTEESAKANKEVEKTFIDMKDASKDAIDSIVDNVSSGENAFKGLRNVAFDVLSSIQKAILSSAVSSVSSSIGLDSIFSSLKLPGFQTGGQFTVAGSGGTDSQLVQFRASPRERVTIETPQQQRMGSKGEFSVVQNINVSTGVSQTVRAEIQQFLPQFEQISVRAVADARNRGRL